MWTIGICSLLWTVSTALGTMNPDFDDEVVNVTVKAKNTAVLPCSVINLGRYQIVWTDQYSTLLAHEDRRIIDDDRMSVERPYPREWNLHIRDVRFSDQGLYNCQINTDPVRIKMVYLNVQVPASIEEKDSTSNVTIKEGEKVTLVCKVHGEPNPTVTWFRVVKTEKEEVEQRVGVAGEVLVIHNVTRYCGGSYKCVAYNDVKPAAYRLMDVSVSFAPEVYLPNMRIGQQAGKDTILECSVSAHPISDVWWERNGEKINNQEHKYRVEIYDQSLSSLTLSVRIYNLDRFDFGVYTCFASNKHGNDHQDMVLYDYNRHLRTTTTTTTTTAIPTTSFYYLPGRYHGQHHNNNGGGSGGGNQYHNGYNNHQDKKAGHQPGGYNVQGQVHQGQHGGHSQGRGYSGRPGSLTGSQGSDHIYTPPYHQGNRGSVQPARAPEDGAGGSSCRPCSNVEFLLVVVMVVSLLVNQRYRSPL